jgi:hypothetical protein
MSKAELIERDRTQIAELKEKYGLTFPVTDEAPPLKFATDLKMTRSVLSPPKMVIPCAVELKDVGKVDPCLVVPSSLPIELLPKHKSIAVGGQVLSLSRSLYTMSHYLMDEAFRAQGFWNGQPLPILVSIKGTYKYLVKQKSYFFKFENFVGSDIDQLSPMEPDQKDLKLNRYHWGSDLTDELTVVVAEY